MIIVVRREAVCRVEEIEESWPRVREVELELLLQEVEDRTEFPSCFGVTGLSVERE